MKNPIKCLFVLLALACGAPGEEYADHDTADVAIEDVELGTLEQGLTRPTGYGYNHSNFLRCTGLSGCNLPVDKNMTYRFYASTCSSWWQARMVTAVDSWQNIMNDLGFTVAFANTPDIELRCGNLPTGYSGQATAKGEVLRADGHYSFTGSAIVYDTAEVEGSASWAGKTDVQRQRKAINLIAHELGHPVGLGHAGQADPGPDPTVMHNHDEYNSTPYYSDRENNMIADYVP